MSAIATATASPRSAGRTNALGALRHRDFRLFWTGLTASAVGTWMQIVAQSLLVLKITNGSAFALGTVSLTQACAFISFALIGGSISDRFDKRRVLMFTQCLSAALAILLGFLTAFGVIRLWMILALAFFNGILLCVDQPARSALVSALVPEREIGNAISLQAMIFNGASTFGPLLAGFCVARFGYAGNFFLNGASFLAVLIALSAMRVPATPHHQQSTIHAIRGALAVVRRDAVLPSILSGYAGLLFLGPSTALILPIYASKILHVGPERLGLLFSAVGLGTIFGSIGLASLKETAQRIQIYFAGMFIWSVALTGFGFSRWFWLSVLSLLIFGFAQTLVATTTITLLQTRVPVQMRGRVMSLNTLLLMGIRPLGDFPASALISIVGPVETLLLSAAAVTINALALARHKSVSLIGLRPD